jgi:hypothetical protein
MSKAKKFLVVAGAAVLGVTMIFFGIKEYRNSKKLQAEGKQTVGTVTDNEVRRGRKGRKSYYLTVTFKTEASTVVEKRKSVSRGLFDDASQAGTVPVTYLPSDPNVCAFGPKVKTEWVGLVVGFGALVVSGVVGFSKSEGDSGPTSEADAEKELLSDNSKYDDQQKAA